MADDIPLSIDQKRPNKKLEQWILSYLGSQETSNPHTNSRGTITPLQISKLVPDSILRSLDDIQNTIYNMQERRLLQEVVARVGYGQFKYEEEETPFQITVDGIIQFRKSIRPIARLVINHEEQYQTIVDRTEGDPQVKAELKKIPEKIKDRIEGYSKVKAELKKVPKKIRDRIEDKVIDALIDSVQIYGSKAGIFFAKLIFFSDSD